MNNHFHIYPKCKSKYKLEKDTPVIQNMFQFLFDKNKYLRIQKIFHKSPSIMLKVGWKCGTELEEDVCSHAVDPEHEGEEGVDD